MTDERPTSRTRNEMTCDAFARWLDDGEAPSGAAAAHAHGATCARCAEALADLHAFEAWVSAPVSAPVRSDRPRDASRRLGGGARAAVADAPIGDSMPWWVRVASQPSVVLAAALAALIVGFAPAIASGASSPRCASPTRGATSRRRALASGSLHRSTCSPIRGCRSASAWGALPADRAGVARPAGLGGGAF